MKILVLGQTSSFWLKEYVVKALDPINDEIYVLYDSHYGEDVKREYEKKNIHLIYTDRGIPVISKIPKIRTIVNLYYHILRVCKKKKFDVIEFQGMPVGLVIKFFEKMILKYADSVVCMYWGSDLLATPEKKVKYAEGCLKKAKYILFDSNNLKDRFHEIFGTVYDEKFVDTRLGTSIFDDLDVVYSNVTKKECKAYFGIPDNQKVIAVGYNGRRRQQHMEVLKQLIKLGPEELENYTILVHLGYGLESQEYKKEIEEYLKNNFKNYKIIEVFLDKKSTAMLRRSVDIFIHAQISDALAGSVKEYLYAGAILINPKWIDYSECKDIGIKYLEYENWDEIPGLLCKAMQMDKKEFEQNRKLLYSNFSWDAVKEKWDEIHGRQ